jgi:predicted PurR-regulated permease PerM
VTDDPSSSATTPSPLSEAFEASTRRRQTSITIDTRSLVLVSLALVLVAALVAVFDAAEDVVIPIGVGLLLGLALDPAVRAVQRHGASRHQAAVVIGLSAFALVALLVVLVGPATVDQAREFEQDLPETVQGFYDLPVIGSWLEDNDAERRVEEYVAELPAKIDDETIEDTANSLIGGAVSMLIAVAVAFTVMFDGEALVSRARSLIADRHRPQADRVGQVLYGTFGNYFGGSLTIAVLMGVYVLILALLFGVPLAPVAAVWAMITNFIPQIGGFLGGSFLTVLALSVSVPVAIAVALLFVIYMNLENNVLQPAIIGEAVDLSPPTTMVAALVGGAMAGVPGALVATPVVGATKRLYFEIRRGAVPEHKGSPSVGDRVRRLFHRDGNGDTDDAGAPD